MKDIKFEVSDEIYWKFVAQVDNGVSIPIPGGVRRRVLVQVMVTVIEKVRRPVLVQIYSQIERS